MTRDRRAVIYARFSPRPDAEESESIFPQVQHCREFAKKQGWFSGPEFSDQARSGADARRRGLWKAVGALDRGDVLLVHRLDRLARDVPLLLLIESRVAERGAFIISCADEGTWDDSIDARFMRLINAVIGEYRRLKGNERTSDAMTRHQERGRRMTRPDRTPFGWRVDPDHPDRLVEHDGEQRILAEIEELARAGRTPIEIAGKLNDAGMTPRSVGRKPAEWRRSAIAKIVDRLGLDQATDRPQILR